MKKIIENFKQMPLFYKIASFTFLAALVIFIFSTFIGYIGDIFFFGIFKAMFENIYGFFAVILYFIETILQILFVAALIIAMLSGEKKNVAFVLLCKAMIVAINLFFVNPFRRVLLVMSYGFKASIIPGSTVFGGFISFIYMLALIALAILLLNGFGKFTKIAGFITIGVFSVTVIYNIIDLISAMVQSVKDFIQGSIAEGVFGLTAEATKCCALIVLMCGFIVLALAVIFASKAKRIPKEG